jgi:hypothetical protein
MTLFDNPSMGLLDDELDAPRPQGSLAERFLSIFAGSSDPRLSPEQNAQLRRRAMLQAGLGALGASGQGASGLQALGAAAGAGNAARMSFSDDMVDKQAQAELAQLAQSGQLTPDVLKQLFQRAVATGNVGMASAIVGMANNLQPEADDGIILGGEGNRYVLRKGTGEVVRDLGAPGSKFTGNAQKGINPDTGKVELFDTDQNGKIRWLGVAPPPETRSDTSSFIENQRQFQREQTLVNEYQEAVKPFKETFHKINGTLASVPLAKQGDGAAQNELVVTFVVALDPTSVAREGEVDLARKAASVWDQAQAAYKKYLKGEAVLLPPELIGKMEDMLKRRNEGYARRWKDSHSSVTKRAQRWNVDADAFDAPPTFGGGGKKSWQDRANELRGNPDMMKILRAEGYVK